VAKRGGERTGEERKGDRVGEADAARTEAAKLLLLRAGEIGPKRLEGLDATPGTGLRLMAREGLDSRFSNFIVASKAAACAFERLAAAALAKRPGGLRLRERRPPLALNDPPAPMVAPGSYEPRRLAGGEVKCGERMPNPVLRPSLLLTECFAISMRACSRGLRGDTWGTGKGRTGERVGLAAAGRGEGRGGIRLVDAVECPGR
jgi:hypothetical protein